MLQICGVSCEVLKTQQHVVPNDSAAAQFQKFCSSDAMVCKLLLVPMRCFKYFANHLCAFFVHLLVNICNQDVYLNKSVLCCLQGNLFFPIEKNIPPARIKKHDKIV